VALNKFQFLIKVCEMRAMFMAAGQFQCSGMMLSAVPEYPAEFPPRHAAFMNPFP
jgi:hypothetical protein